MDIIAFSNMDTFTVLQAFSKAVKKSIKVSNLNDTNVKKGGLFTKVIILSNKPHRTYIYANVDYLLIELKFINFESKFVFSINNKDQILILNEKAFNIQSNDKLFPVYLVKATINRDKQEIKNWFLSGQNLRSVNSINLEQDENLHVYRNGLSLFIKSRSVNELNKILDSLYQLVDSLPKNRQEQLNFSKLPREFHKLIPLIKKWGIVDDVQRNEKLQKVTREEKKNLHENVKPYFSMINRYLDSFGNNSFPEEVIALQCTAEAAAEVALEFKN